MSRIAAKPVATSLDSGSTTTNASSYATTSKTFTAGRLYLLHGTGTGTAVATPTSVTFTVATTAWTLIVAGASGTVSQQIICYAIIPASNVTDTVTVSYGAQAITGFDWVIEEITGHSPTSLADAVPTTQATAATASSTTPSSTLTAAPRSNSLTIGAAFDQNTAFTAGANFTKLVETLGHANPSARMAVEGDSGTAQQICNWTITTGSWVASAVEVRAPTYAQAVLVSQAVNRAAVI